MTEEQIKKYTDACGLIMTDSLKRGTDGGKILAALHKIMGFVDALKNELIEQRIRESAEAIVKLQK